MNVAFIPVRGGSKSIPLKNIRPIHGKPLVYWTVNAACHCKDIDQVYVATDSDAIRNTVDAFVKAGDAAFAKVQVIDRSAETASDTASTESAMLEFAQNYEFDNIVLIQATSPLLAATDLDEGFKTYQLENTDSVMSVVRQKRFHWAVNAEGIATPTNYDVFHRPRRQEFDGYLVENGAFYITSKKDLLATENRVSGKIRLVEMDERTYFEIDEPSDWMIIEKFMQDLDDKKKKVSVDLSTMKALLTDCDGCLTDGGMYYSEKGDELKKFNTKDGMAFGLLRQKGIRTGVVTGENVDLNRRRVEKVKADAYVPGCTDKLSAVEQLCRDWNISLQEVAYIGDDINDVELLRKVGYSCCPADAMELVQEEVDYVAKAEGGKGVFREVADHILAAGV